MSQNSVSAVSRSITGCFATQNIGEVSARTEGLKNTHSKGNELRCHPLPLPCPVALRGTTKQYKGKAAFQSPSPVFCNTKYRGGVRRTEGLIFTAKNFMKSFQPLSSKQLYLRCLSYISNATPRNTTGHGRGEEQTQYTGKYYPPPLCFA